MALDDGDDADGNDADGNDADGGKCGIFPKCGFGGRG